LHRASNAVGGLFSPEGCLQFSAKFSYEIGGVCLLLAARIFKSRRQKCLLIVLRLALLMGVIIILEQIGACHCCWLNFKRPCFLLQYPITKGMTVEAAGHTTSPIQVT
jgi:hypothetical protein